MFAPRVAAFALIAFAVDQVSKWLVVFGLGLNTAGAIDVIPPLLRFRMGWNEGINFGLFASGSETLRWFLVIVSIVVAGIILFWTRRYVGWFGPMLAGALVGGILGNGVDRVVHGAVADFLSMSCCGISNPFSFNLADVFIFAGAFGMILFSKWIHEQGAPDIHGE